MSSITYRSEIGEVVRIVAGSSVDVQQNFTQNSEMFQVLRVENGVATVRSLGTVSAVGASMSPF